MLGRSDGGKNSEVHGVRKMSEFSRKSELARAGHPFVEGFTGASLPQVESASPDCFFAGTLDGRDNAESLVVACGGCECRLQRRATGLL